MHNSIHYVATYAALERYDNTRDSRALLDRMIRHAESDPQYRTRLDTWLGQGGTVELRELSNASGHDLNSLTHFNLVDAIDSAHLHRFDPQPLKDRQDALNA